MGNGNGLNTLEYVQKLEQAGIPRKQAEAQAFVLYDLITSNLSSKRDIKELETNLKRDIKELETNLKRDMKELETNLKRDMKELETRLELKIEMANKDLKIWLSSIAAGGIILLVALGQLGLLTPPTS